MMKTFLHAALLAGSAAIALPATAARQWQVSSVARRACAREPAAQANQGGDKPNELLHHSN
jgi:hypothetical protein